MQNLFNYYTETKFRMFNIQTGEYKQLTCSESYSCTRVLFVGKSMHAKGNLYSLWTCILICFAQWSCHRNRYQTRKNTREALQIYMQETHSREHGILQNDHVSKKGISFADTLFLLSSKQNMLKTSYIQGLHVNTRGTLNTAVFQKWIFVTSSNL